MSKEPPLNYDVLFEERLSGEARQLRARAKTLPPGPLREEALRKAEQAELGVAMNRMMRPYSTRNTR